MDGIHDMGGMRGFGKIEAEVNEPVFHTRWEGRAFALMSLAGGFANVDAGRHAIEQIPPADYLSLPYYGRWLRALEMQLVEAGVLEDGELAARAAGAPFERREPLGDRPTGSPTASRRLERAPLYRVGQAVRTRNLHPPGHTRLAGYVRARRGVVEIVHPGAWVLPDSNAHDRGEQPQPVYSVGFDGRELWGDDAEAGTAVCIDLFESYLEPGHEPDREPDR